MWVGVIVPRALCQEESAPPPLRLGSKLPSLAASPIDGEGYV